MEKTKILFKKILAVLALTAILFLFLIGLTYNCELKASEPFIRNYDLFQDSYNKKMFNNKVSKNNVVIDSIVITNNPDVNIVDSYSIQAFNGFKLLLNKSNNYYTYWSNDGAFAVKGDFANIYFWDDSSYLTSGNNNISIVDPSPLANYGLSINNKNIKSNISLSNDSNMYFLTPDTFYFGNFSNDKAVSIHGNIINIASYGRIKLDGDMYAYSYYGNGSYLTGKIDTAAADARYIKIDDTNYLTITNSDTIYSDTSITADTQMDVINDTACFIIYGDSYAVDLIDYDFSYKINISGYWYESSQLVYLDETNNRIVFKADINTFAPNTIKFNFWRVKK